MEIDHDVLIWAWRSGQPEINGETGFVNCMMSVAKVLLDRGVAQSSRLNMREFHQIDDPVQIKKLAAKNSPVLPSFTAPSEKVKAKIADVAAHPEKVKAKPIEEIIKLEQKLRNEAGGKLKYVGKK